MKAHVEVICPVELTPRVRQMAGLFDVELSQIAHRSWEHDLPLEEQDWNVGLIIGPSGAGKSHLARELWPEQVVTGFVWDDKKALIDGFPEDLSIKTVTGMLTNVGLGSPPAWMRPYRTLSTGEAFRATIARALAENDGLVVIDEFTSVVDRQVAKVASHAVQKAIRKAKRQLVAVTCHYDVEDWLQPDWTYDAAVSEFRWRQVQPHPPIELEIRECSRALWPAFAHHHYLSPRLHVRSYCSAAYVEGRPVAFNAYLDFPHPHTRQIKMAHRLVVLPDWQGLGISGILADFWGQRLWDRGERYHFVVAHPAMISYFRRSPRWREIGGKRTLATGTKDMGMRRRQIKPRTLGTRSFEYVAPKKAE